MVARASAAGWSVRRSRLTAVEPERPALDRADPEQAGRRPGILAKARLDFVLVRGLDGVQGLAAIADWAAEDDKTMVDEPVYERRVLIPGVLVPDLARDPSLGRGPASPRKRPWRERTGRRRHPA